MGWKEKLKNCKYKSNFNILVPKMSYNGRLSLLVTFTNPLKYTTIWNLYNHLCDYMEDRFIYGCVSAFYLMSIVAGWWFGGTCRSCHFCPKKLDSFYAIISFANRSWMTVRWHLFSMIFLTRQGVNPNIHGSFTPLSLIFVGFHDWSWGW